jgi:hypothetical protein
MADERLGVTFTAKDDASATTARVTAVIKKAAVDLELAQLRVEKATAAAAAATKKHGEKSIQAREAIARLTRAELGQEAAAGKLAGAQHKAAAAADKVTTAAPVATNRTQALTGWFGKLKENALGVGLAVVGAAGALASAGKVMGEGLSQGLVRANAQIALGAKGFETLNAAAAKSAHGLGLTTTEFLNSSGQAALLARNMGFSEDTAVSFGKQLPDLANRISVLSSGQRSAAESSDILRSALAGEFDPLQAVGINISANIVAQKALEIQQRSGASVTQQQANALAILSIVTDQTSQATEVLGTKMGKAYTEAQSNTAQLREEWQKLEQQSAPLISGFLKYISTLTDYDKMRSVIVDGKFPDEEKKTGDAAHAAAGGMNAATQAATALAAAQDKADQAAQKAAEGILGERAALRGFYEALDAARAALQTNGKTLDVHTAKGRTNAAALDGMASAAASEAQQLKANGATEQAYQGNLEASRRKLEAMAMKFGMSGAAAHAYSLRVLGIPETANTVVKTPGLSAAQANIRYFKYLLGTIPRTVTVTTRYIADRRSVYNQQVPSAARASGGWIPGPPSSVDTVPAMLATGEYVVNSRAARAHGPMPEAINRSGYASGGLVAPERFSSYARMGTPATSYARMGRAGGTAMIYNITVQAPNYVGDTDDMVKALDRAARGGRLDRIVKLASA